MRQDNQLALDFSKPVASEMSLRPYQEAALADLFSAIDAGEHPVCALATGGGKSVLIAALCAELPGRVLVATHRKELLEQNSEVLSKWMPSADYGIYSAGLDSRETDARVIFGGIQSIYRRMHELQRAGRFGAVITDEAHAVAPKSQDSMYRTVFEACPAATRIGFSATPYRLDDGPIYGEGCWYTSLTSHVGIDQLTVDGYLSPLSGVLTAADVPLEGVRKQGGEYVLSDLSQAASERAVAELAVKELCTLAQNRQSWLVFCVDVAHTELITRLINAQGVRADLIVGRTPSDDRERILNAFRSRKLRVLVNCMVGTEGFDIPCVDCVALLRPTLSKRLVVQMIGRGTRLYDGKRDTLILDMAGNLERHVPLDGFPFVSKSPARAEQDEQKEKEVRAQREREAKHGVYASLTDPRYAVQIPAHELDVYKVFVDLAPSKKQAGKTNLRIRYLCYDDAGVKTWVTEWLCPEYSGWAGHQASAWFARRGLTMPPNARVALAMAKEARVPESILVSREGGWDRVKMEHFEGRGESDG